MCCVLFCSSSAHKGTPTMQTVYINTNPFHCKTALQDQKCVPFLSKSPYCSLLYSFLYNDRHTKQLQMSLMQFRQQILRILKNKLKLEAIPYNGPIFEGFLVIISITSIYMPKCIKELHLFPTSTAIFIALKACN